MGNKTSQLGAVVVSSLLHPQIQAPLRNRTSAVTDGSYGANGASGCILWLDPSLQLIRIYLTHYFLGDFREANPVMNAAFPG
jgi:hypothetical protein